MPHNVIEISFRIPKDQWLKFQVTTRNLDIHKSKYVSAKSIEERLIQELKSPSLTLVFVTLINIGTLSCLFFEQYISVYVSLAGRALLRSSMVAVGSSFLRLRWVVIFWITVNNDLKIINRWIYFVNRFPAEHFDRLNGISGTTAGFFLFVQYPFFVWSQNNFLAVSSCQILISFFSYC